MTSALLFQSFYYPRVPIPFGIIYRQYLSGSREYSNLHCKMIIWLSPSYLLHWNFQISSILSIKHLAIGTSTPPPPHPLGISNDHSWCEYRSFLDPFIEPLPYVQPVTCLQFKGVIVGILSVTVNNNSKEILFHSNQ